MGPLVDERAVTDFAAAVGIAQEQGGELLYGGNVIDGPGHFVEPTIIKMPEDAPISRSRPSPRSSIWWRSTRSRRGLRTTTA